jgi:cell fate regulator YaaT (PSP1 superfamily)
MTPPANATGAHPANPQAPTVRAPDRPPTVVPNREHAGPGVDGNRASLSGAREGNRRRRSRRHGRGERGPVEQPVASRAAPPEPGNGGREGLGEKAFREAPAPRAGLPTHPSHAKAANDQRESRREFRRESHAELQWDATAESSDVVDEIEVPPPPVDDETDTSTVSEVVFRDEPLLTRDPDGEDVFAELDEGPPSEGVLCNSVGVKFRDAGKIHEFDAGERSYGRGERVVVETDKGLSIGVVAVASARRLVRDLPRRVIRRADQNDVRQEQRNQRRENEALKFASQRVRERRLGMKLFRVEYLHGGNKATFFFSSEGRIDFRDLVKDLTHRLHTRVELRQVGVRDEAKMVGGIGTCGRELCCSTWLPRFEPVSIRMAKDQNLVLNPQKVSGVCGRLKCCLIYEEALYRELRKGLPKVGKRVITPKGEGKVQELDILGGRVKVWFEGGPPVVFGAKEVHPVAPPGGAVIADEVEPDEPEPNDELLGGPA